MRLPETPLSKRSKSSFLFSAIFHIYIFVGSSVGILWLIPCILFALKQRKMKTLVSAMASHQAKPIEAVAASTSVPAEQTEALITTSVPIPVRKTYRNGHPYKSYDKTSMPWTHGCLS